MSAWLLLVLAGLLEIVWATALQASNGFTRLWPSLIGVATAWASFVLLAYALRSLPVGTAYAVWTGIGVVGVATIGILMQGDSADKLRLAALAMVAVGIIGLRFAEP